MPANVILDDDVELLLQVEVRRTHSSLTTAANDAIRASFQRKSKPSNPQGKTFAVIAKPMSLNPEIDPTGFNRLVDDLELEDFVSETHRVQR